MSSYILLGKTGDIISVLPFLKAEADAGDKPTLIVSNQHTSVLEGVSYVNVVPFDGGIHLLRPAWDWAKAKYPEVKSLQVIGNAKDVGEITYRPAGKKCATCTSFIKEMWSLAGKLNAWDNVLPLVFDKRSPERETALVDCCGLAKRPGSPGRPRKQKPLLLVDCKGHSSPFPYADLLMELLRLKFGTKYQILEVPHAERIYDLLALYERAYCLVAVDSAPLHLARAVPSLPVIALTNDRPMMWNGSPWLSQWVWCSRYHDWPERATEMLVAIEHCRDLVEACPFFWVWNEYEPTGIINYSYDRVPIFKGACGRDSANVLKDQKRIPYLKDCLRMGLQRATFDDLVCLSRPGIVFTDLKADLWKECDAMYAYRLTANGSGDTFSPIVDMLCASKAFWRSHLAEIPDLLFGGDYQWSEALRVMFEKYGARDVTGVCYRVAKEKK